MFQHSYNSQMVTMTSESCDVSHDNDSKEKINKYVASDDNELDDDIEDDGEKGSDVGEKLRRIYNCKLYLLVTHS